MPVKIQTQCARCRRDDFTDVESIEAAVKTEEANKKKTAQAAAIAEFLKKIPADLMPDAIVFVKGSEPTIHTNLCNPASDKKRSCLKRLNELAQSMTELEERKPRTKKQAA